MRRRARSLPPGVVLLVLAGSGVCGSFMQTILIPLQPRLPELLDAAPSDTAWAVTITLLSAAVSTPIAGRLGDLFGKRRVMLILLALLVGGSVLIATTGSLPVVLVGRALQGCAVGLVPLAMSVARDILPAARIPGAVALISATLGIGGAAGLPLSAVIAELGDWHTLFWAVAGIGAVAALLIVLVVPPGTRGHGRFDVLGALGLGVGLVGVLLAITRGQLWGWTSPATIGSAVGGLVVLGLWGWYQYRAAHPLVDVRLAVRPEVLPAHLAALAMGFSLLVGSVAFPQVLQLSASTGYGSGLTLIEAALTLTPQAIGMIIVSSFAGRLMTLLGPRTMLLIGAVVIAAGYALAALWSLEPLAVLAVNAVTGLGIGFGYSALPTLVIAATPVQHTAAANALNALMRSIGTTTAAAVVGAILVGLRVPHDGALVPSQGAFVISLVLGAAAALVTALLALWLPRRR